MNDTHGPIDCDTLTMLRRELGDGFARVLGYFRDDGEQAVAAIEAAVRARNACALVRPAHKLKGEALQFGATALGLVAERIEMAARAAVEDHVFPVEVIEQAVALRAHFGEAMALLMLDAAPCPPPVSRRPVGFGRKVVGRG